MFKLLKSILLATNLQDYNKGAFDVAMSLATHYDANLVLLHVVEKIPEQIMERMKWIVDDEQLERFHKAKTEEIKKSLIGKNISNAVLREALAEYCRKINKDTSVCLHPNRNIIVCEGDVVEMILKTSNDHDCGMIILSTQEGLFGKASISKVIKNVMEQSAIPVLSVPSKFHQ